MHMTELFSYDRSLAGEFKPNRPFLLRFLALGVVALCHGAMWVARHKQRHTLLALEDHQLEDIGVTREQATKEARKPFWRA